MGSRMRLLCIDPGDRAEIPEESAGFFRLAGCCLSPEGKKGVGVLCIKQRGGGEAFTVCRLDAGHPNAKLDLRFSLADGRVLLKNKGTAALHVTGYKDSLSTPVKRRTAGTAAVDAGSADASADAPRDAKKRKASIDSADSTAQPATSNGMSEKRKEKKKKTAAAVQQAAGQWKLNFVDSTGPRLDRHEGAQRDAKPAWMTKGLGVGTKMFGEVGSGKDELLKPGMTRGALEALEKKALTAATAPDPFAEVFAEGQQRKSEAEAASAGKSWRQAGPLPDQGSIFASSGRGTGQTGRGGGSKGRGHQAGRKK
eukprot:TRINITY_DN73472_c0_g1_i1.p1 TRINITY_DN73472_c0_g1~~TRINITY_DN73472_c0_g1_i1.p1  ORF type:complete len:311 (-),score=74.76 TRINITY_DN73472_c0_g1_i1:78-1010(-)